MSPAPPLRPLALLALALALLGCGGGAPAPAARDGLVPASARPAAPARLVRCDDGGSGGVLIDGVCL